MLTISFLQVFKNSLVRMYLNDRLRETEHNVPCPPSLRNNEEMHEVHNLLKLSIISEEGRLENINKKRMREVQIVL